MTHELIPLHDDRQRNFYQYLETHPFISTSSPLFNLFPLHDQKGCQKIMKHLSDCSGPRADDRGLIIHYARFPKRIYLVKRISTSTCLYPLLFLAMLAPHVVTKWRSRSRDRNKVEIPTLGTR